MALQLFYCPNTKNKPKFPGNPRKITTVDEICFSKIDGFWTTGTVCAEVNVAGCSWDFYSLTP